MSRARTRKILEPDPAAPPRACEWPDCAHGAGFPAPKSRTQLREYRWFCLEHVRRYNASWDYYAGMSGDEIERHLRADTTWRRPSWPLGARPRKRGAPGPWDDLVDPFGLFEGPDAVGPRPAAMPEKPGQKLTPAQRKAMAVMRMEAPLTMETLRARYKALVKQYHPDANGGDRAAEEKLKAINLAYSSLKQSLREHAR